MAWAAWSGELAYRTLKYRADPTVVLPKGARILSVGEQGGVPMLWAIVEDTAPLVERRLLAIWTGMDLPNSDPGRYIGTIHSAGGLVTHYFDLGETR